MKRNLLLLLALFFQFVSHSQTFIRHVTIVDVVRQKLIPGQTVTLTNGLISGIQPANKVRIPPNAEVINGEGKFLIPGMTDAHVHFFQSGGLYARPDVIDLRKFRPFEKELISSHNSMEDFLRRYVQNGITSVIDVGATNSFLNQRDTFRLKYFAPGIFMTGPLLTSYQPANLKDLGHDEPFSLVATPEEGRKSTKAQLPLRPDFIKVWYIVNETNKDSLEASAKRFQPVLKAIIDEAHSNNLRVAVHATQQLAAKLAVESGCDYLVHGVENEIVSDEFIKLLKERNVILSPTLIVAGRYYKTFAQTMDYTSAELMKSNPQQVGSVEDLKHLPDTVLIKAYKNSIRSERFTRKWRQDDSIRMTNLKRLADGGVIIAAGTDAGNIGTQHATSFYEELLAMKRSGLSNWQIIQSATINPTRILNLQDSLGSITVGKKADLVLLNANPVDDIRNISQIDLVVNKGHVIKPDTLIAPSPETLVQQQLNAYNARNIDAFLEPYADDVELYTFPNKLLGKGKEIMRSQYGNMFTNLPNLHCEVKSRIVKGNIVIDHESVAGFGGPGNVEAIAVYEIKNGKISKVFFME